jgi:predicted nucleotide-binding protein (sugar kinase/HSP70/actin superfamily)
MHVGANQDLIRVLEKYGAEVANSSLAEWVNYISYDGLRGAKNGLQVNLNQLRLGPTKACFKKMLNFGADLFYKMWRQKQIYKKVEPLIDLAEDHKISHLEHILKEEDIFSFDLGTEACLSIAAAMKCARGGYNGVVNVYPFTCMPSMTTSAVVKPLMNEMGVPYLDTPYDSGTPPGREAEIRTFMYQAYEHHKRYGRKAK